MVWLVNTIHGLRRLMAKTSVKAAFFVSQRQQGCANLQCGNQRIVRSDPDGCVGFARTLREPGPRALCWTTLLDEVVKRRIAPEILSFWEQ